MKPARLTLAAVWLLAASACGEDKELTVWCQQACLRIGPSIAEEGPSTFDPEEYDAGCNALAPATCADCQEELTVHLDRFGVQNECYCLVPSGERDQGLLSDQQCATIVEHHGSESALEELCECRD